MSTGINVSDGCSTTVQWCHETNYDWVDGGHLVTKGGLTTSHSDISEK